MVLLWAGSGSLALAKEVSLSPDLGGEDTSKLGDFPVPDLKITPVNLPTAISVCRGPAVGFVSGLSFLFFRGLDALRILARA